MPSRNFRAPVMRLAMRGCRAYAHRDENPTRYPVRSGSRSRNRLCSGLRQRGRATARPSERSHRSRACANHVYDSCGLDLDGCARLSEPSASHRCSKTGTRHGRCSVQPPRLELCSRRARCDRPATPSVGVLLRRGFPNLRDRRRLTASAVGGVLSTCVLAFCLDWARAPATPPPVPASAPIANGPHTIIEGGASISAEHGVLDLRPWDQYLLAGDEDLLPLVLQLRHPDFQRTAKEDCRSVLTPSADDDTCRAVYFLAVEATSVNPIVRHVTVDVESEDSSSCVKYVQCRVPSLLGAPLRLPAGKLPGDGRILRVVDMVSHERLAPEQLPSTEIERLETILARPDPEGLDKMPSTVQRLQRVLRREQEQRLLALRDRIR